LTSSNFDFLMIASIFFMLWIIKIFVFENALKIIYYYKSWMFSLSISLFNTF